MSRAVLSSLVGKQIQKAIGNNECHRHDWNGMNGESDNSVPSCSLALRDTLGDQNETNEPTQTPNRNQYEGLPNESSISIVLTCECKIESDNGPSHKRAGVEESKAERDSLLSQFLIKNGRIHFLNSRYNAIQSLIAPYLHGWYRQSADL